MDCVARNDGEGPIDDGFHIIYGAPVLPTQVKPRK
jgi:hypothetical protein